MTPRTPPDDPRERTEGRDRVDGVVTITLEPPPRPDDGKTRHKRPASRARVGWRP